jgi:DDE superfamily endonuclease
MPEVQPVLEPGAQRLRAAASRRAGRRPPGAGPAGGAAVLLRQPALRGPDRCRALLAGCPRHLDLDNLNTHGSAVTRQFTGAHPDCLTVIQLPAYAPELNPEGVWSNMKMGWATSPSAASTSSPRKSGADSGTFSTGPSSSPASSARRDSASSPTPVTAHPSL